MQRRGIGHHIRGESEAERKIVLETRWKLFGYGILGYVLLAMIGFAFLTKPFLSFEMVKYTSITIPLNAMILITGAVVLGSWIAKKQPYTGEIFDKGLSGISLGQFIWMHYGFPLVIAVVLWGIYILKSTNKLGYFFLDLSRYCLRCTGVETVYYLSGDFI